VRVVNANITLLTDTSTGTLITDYPGLFIGLQAQQGGGGSTPFQSDLISFFMSCVFISGMCLRIG
jgi:hypothetical protein